MIDISTTPQQTTAQVAKPVFEAKTSDVVDLKRLVKTAAAVVTDMPVTVDADGVRFHGADPSMVGMIDFRLRPEFFGRYEFDAEDPVRFWINMDQLKDRVTEASKGDDLTLIVRDGDSMAKPVVDVKVWTDGITSTFSLETLDLEDQDRPETEDLEFSGSALVGLPMLRAAIQKMEGSIEFTLREDALVLESEADGETARVRFPDTSDHLHAVALSDGPVTSLYSVDYLAHVRKLRKTVQRVRVQFGDDFPLRVTAEDDRFKLAYTLAPRIEEG